MGVIAGLTTTAFSSQSLQYVKSIQQVSIALGNGVTSNTATITSVNTATTFLVYQGFTSSSGSGVNVGYPIITLTNATTVTAQRNTSDTGTVTINCTVVECYATLVQSVQYGTISISANATGVASITEVNPNNSEVFYLGMTATVGDSGSRDLCGVALNGSSSVVAFSLDSSVAGTFTATVGFVVVTFNPAAIKSIQRFYNSFSTSSAADTQNINAITTANTLLAFGGMTCDTSSWTNFCILSIGGSTSITLTRVGSTTLAPRITAYSVIEFVSGVVKSNQSGSIALTGATSNTATISSVNINKTILAFVGLNGNIGSSAFTTNAKKVTLTNATTVTGTINTSEASAKNVGFQAVEFN